MTNQALSTEHLSGLAAASLVAVPASKLVDILAQQEPEIVLLFTDRSISGDVDFLSSFYASYLIALLLVDDLYVQQPAPS